LEQKSENFECKTSLGQEDTLPPILNLVLVNVIRDIQEVLEMEIIGVNTLLAYADDIIILGTSQKGIRNRIRIKDSNKKLE